MSTAGVCAPSYANRYVQRQNDGCDTAASMASEFASATDQSSRGKRRGGARPGPRGRFGCVFTQGEALPMCMSRGSQVDRTASKRLQLLPRQSVLHMHIGCIGRAGDACSMKL